MSQSVLFLNIANRPRGLVHAVLADESRTLGRMPDAICGAYPEAWGDERHEGVTCSICARKMKTLRAAEVNTAHALSRFSDADAEK